MPINHVVQVVKKSKFYKSQKPLLSDGKKVFNDFMKCLTSVDKSTFCDHININIGISLAITVGKRSAEKVE